LTFSPSGSVEHIGTSTDVDPGVLGRPFKPRGVAATEAVEVAPEHLRAALPALDRAAKI
jgi:hypothetical protein